jgi:hypothetical protein
MNLREAAQQALEAWSRPNGINYVDFRPYMEALRTALAEPEQEPVALETVYETIINWDESGGKRSRRELAQRIVALYTHPADDTALLRQALSTLDGWANYGKWVWPESALEQAKRNTEEAITALRERLGEKT